MSFSFYNLLFFTTFFYWVSLLFSLIIKAFMTINFFLEIAFAVFLIGLTIRLTISLTSRLSGYNFSESFHFIEPSII